jgi:thiol-disulfide isomerase/thioredoxin
VSPRFLPALITGMLAVGVLGSVSCSSSHKQTTSKANKDDWKAAANFSLEDNKGGMSTLADYKGKVVLLNFWATWCGPCKIEIPWFIEFQNTYKDRGFSVLGVALDDDGWKMVKPYIAEKKMNYPVMVGNDQISQLYGGISSVPTSFLIDREGRIQYVHIGLESKDVYEKEIQNLIAGQKTTADARIPSLDQLSTR